MEDSEAYQKRILAAVGQHGLIEDSGVLATEMGLEHTILVGCIKSLEASESIVTEVLHPRSQNPTWSTIYSADSINCARICRQ
jgi:hypothetical protein